MGIQYEGDTTDELLRLARENNKMLRAMRRGSFISGVFKVILWIALIVVPLWFYLEYIAPVLQATLEAYQQVQTTGAAAQAQFGELNQYLEQFQGLIGGGQ